FFRRFDRKCARQDETPAAMNTCGLELRPPFGFPDAKCRLGSPFSELAPATPASTSQASAANASRTPAACAGARTLAAWLCGPGGRRGCPASYGLAVGSHQVPLAVLVADVHPVGAACTHVARVSVQGFATVGDLDGSVAAVDGPQHCRVDSVAGAR